MRSKPPIDTGEVKGVATLGEQADQLSIIELAKANGAILTIDDAVAGFINPRSDRRDRAIVKALRSDIPDVVVDLAAGREIIVDFVVVVVDNIGCSFRSRLPVVSARAAAEA